MLYKSGTSLILLLCIVLSVTSCGIHPLKGASANKDISNTANNTNSNNAETPNIMVTFASGSNECRINDGNDAKAKNLGEAVTINGTKTYLPINIVIEAFKGNTSYNKETKSLIATVGGDTIEFMLENPEIKVNGQKKPADPSDKKAAPYESKAGNFMVPVAAIRYYTALQIEYNKGKQTISIRNKPGKNSKTSGNNGKDQKLDSVDLDSLIPITEMGGNKYKGYEGGLYPGGLNTPSESNLQEGIKYSSQIKPLNKEGVPDSNGKIVLLSIGMSNTTMEFSIFKKLADSDKQKNPSLVVIDGAQGGQDAKIISDTGAKFWSIVDERLKTGNVSNKQVQAIWLKEAVADENNPFPKDAQILEDYLKTIVSTIQQRYPNTKIIYTSNRTFAGYATSKLNPEPFAYESAFSVKWLIEDRINGNMDKNTPWIAWGPNLWTNGMKGRNDGLVWERKDVTEADGTHPSESGKSKVADILLNFFKTDVTSKQWFLKQD